ncbi:hypothetical protein B0T24DRAFT_642865 [Lasiosphaeria ovina]|uniref:Uncharacterized protein n=1 Tax=Lasiosphaeria ovina TaxID=92902 RepID=A0AAE0JUB6_9PEZI|nr:hypothetical protein B0T24DRAFT_642865 [Lasiosphaeria ovina]
MYTTPVGRRRARTNELLGGEFRPAVEVPTAPFPPASHTMYDEQRLKEGLFYADQTLRNATQRASPLVSHCMTMYKTCLKAALENDGKDEQERQDLLETIHVFLEEIRGNREFRLPCDKVNTAVVDRLAMLRRYGLAIRYRLWTDMVYDGLHISKEESDPAWFERLPRWTQYWDQTRYFIAREASTWRGYLSSPPENVEEKEIQTTLAIYRACNYMGLNFDDTMNTIDEHGDPKSIFYMSAWDMLEDVKWSELRETMYKDLGDLPAVMPAHMHAVIPALQHTIASVADKYADMLDLAAIKREHIKCGYDLWNLDKNCCKAEWREKIKAIKRTGAYKESVEAEAREVEREAVARVTNMAQGHLFEPKRHGKALKVLANLIHQSGSKRCDIRKAIAEGKGQAPVDPAIYLDYYPIVMDTGGLDGFLEV